ncbi:MAG TPA: hypothetical protein VFW82_12315, partial [Dyella sp.]|nr:hypothetical protein [Dyella sp.]
MASPYLRGARRGAGMPGRTGAADLPGVVVRAFVLPGFGRPEAALEDAVFFAVGLVAGDAALAGDRLRVALAVEGDAFV